MSNGNCRPALCELAQSVLYLLFRLSVKRSRRLVKYYYLRVMEYRSCNGNSLTFAARKLIALVAHSGVVAVRELCDKVMCIRNFRCPYYLLKGSVRLCICYIFKYVSVKRKVSCNTTPTCERRLCCAISFMFTPSMRISPCVQS